MDNKLKSVKSTKVFCWTWILRSLEEPKPSLNLTEYEKSELKAKLDKMLAEFDEPLKTKR